MFPSSFMAYLSERLLRPRLLTEIFAVHLLVGHVNAIRQCGHQREYPYGGDYLRRSPNGHPGLKWINDDEEPIDGDGRQCQRGRVHAGALRVWNYVTEYLAKHPMACQKKKRWKNVSKQCIISKVLTKLSIDKYILYLNQYVE